MRADGYRAAWDFDYAPACSGYREEELDADVVVATSAPVACEALERALDHLAPGARAQTVFAVAPVFWARVRLPAPRRRSALAAAIEASGLPVRYVASAQRGSLALGPALAFRGSPAPRPTDWRARPASAAVPEPTTEGTWFLRGAEDGVGARGGSHATGAGTRLGVIDDDAADAERLDLDAEVLVNVERPPRHLAHGTLMVAWAAGLGRHPGAFRGTAPDTSPRLYAIPKPDHDVVSLPLAVLRAVCDGADVVLCATYVEGASSPMLDDALAYARRLGRAGRGALVVLPTGRDASSPEGSVHASWSLGFGEPASDPRALCVGPGARGGGWFLWRDRRGAYRPFANRGPAVRWLAPGDDIVHPFAVPERLFHAESSGASAVAAGALLLVLSANPTLRADEVEAVVTRTAQRCPTEGVPRPAPLADEADVLPRGRDADGHDAKSGYGSLSAEAACLSAEDPVAAALIAIGERGAALALRDARCGDPAVAAAYSQRFAQWAVRACLADEAAWHGLRALLRYLRLVAGRPERQRAQPEGVVVRALAILLRSLTVSVAAPRPSRAVARELRRLCARTAEGAASSVTGSRLEAGLFCLAAKLFPPATAPKRGPVAGVAPRESTSVEVEDAGFPG